MDTGPKISIVTPIHDMENGDFFLSRLTKSLKEQTYTNYEHVITKDGRMAENTNSAIRKATGDIIKVLYLDDYLAHPGALQRIVGAFTGGWLVTGCMNDDNWQTHWPVYTPDIHRINTIGSPSVLAFENIDPLFFDESMTWMLDGDYYKRLHQRYGTPTILNDVNVVIGIHKGQTTNLLTPQQKEKERQYMIDIYD